MKLFIVFWWSGGQRKPNTDAHGNIEWITPPSPYGAVFTNEAAAKAAAAVRNAMVITVESGSRKLPKVNGADWYRRDDKGEPMPVEWREIGDPRAKGPCVPSTTP